MSSNRLSYDECETTQSTQQKVTPLDFALANYTRCNWCGEKDNNKDNNKVSELDFQVRTSIENELLNIDRKASKCSAMKHQPPCPEPTECEGNNYNFKPALLCDRDVVWTNLVKPTDPGYKLSSSTIK